MFETGSYASGEILCSTPGSASISEGEDSRRREASLTGSYTSLALPDTPPEAEQGPKLHALGDEEGEGSEGVRSEGLDDEVCTASVDNTVNHSQESGLQLQLAASEERAEELERRLAAAEEEACERVARERQILEAEVSAAATRVNVAERKIQAREEEVAAIRLEHNELKAAYEGVQELLRASEARVRELEELREQEKPATGRGVELTSSAAQTDAEQEPALAGAAGVIEETEGSGIGNLKDEAVPERGEVESRAMAKQLSDAEEAHKLAVTQLVVQSERRESLLTQKLQGAEEALQAAIRREHGIEAKHDREKSLMNRELAGAKLELRAVSRAYCVYSVFI